MKAIENELFLAINVDFNLANPRDQCKIDAACFVFFVLGHFLVQCLKIGTIDVETAISLYKPPRNFFCFIDGEASFLGREVQFDNQSVRNRVAMHDRSSLLQCKAFECMPYGMSQIQGFPNALLWRPIARSWR